MGWRNTNDQYGFVAKCFHWGLFILIATLLAVGIYMANQSFTPELFTFYKWHKTFGVVALVLIVARLVWRFLSPPPPLPIDTHWFEKWAAHGTHMVLYILILVMPLSGWAMSSAAPFPNLILGNVELPALVAQNEADAKFFSTIHFWSGRLLIAVLMIHASAALFHHFIRRDNILVRMLPGRPR